MKTRNTLICESDFDKLSRLVDTRPSRVADGTLAAELRRGEVVAPTRVPKGVVTMNSKVRIRDLESDERQTYTLVFPKDADITEGRMSVMAPLGTALLGARTGDVVEVKAPVGARRIKLERVLYQPEAAGDYHL